MMALLAGLAFAEPVPERPVETKIEGQCSDVLALEPGKPLPAGLVDPATGLVTCGATVLPTGKALYYKKVQTWADYELAPALRRTNYAYEMDTALFEARLKAATPRPLERPTVQRTLGRVETLITVAAVAGIVYASQR